MDITKKGIISLIKSAITGEKLSLPESFELNNVLTVSKKHNISTIIYYGALNCGISQSESVMNDLFSCTCQNIAVSEMQNYSIKCLFEEFEKANIDFMPLKGSVLKKLYPKPEMRIMGDADILIKTEQYGIIKSIMQKLGYTEAVESDHELAWYKNGMLVELHKRIIPSYNKDFYAYFGDGWRLAKPTDTNRFEMGAEDNMIYLFTHFAKHYRDAGIGIRHIVDLWVYRLHNTDLNEDYINTELQKLGLYEFYVNINKTLANWFDGCEEDSVTELITETIFLSGVYGTEDSHIISSALKTSKKTGKRTARLVEFWKLVFLPLDTMRKKYPILLKLPILLPIMWVVRIVNVLLFKKEKLHGQVENYKYATADRINDYQAGLNFVGLDFNFRE